jgi:RNA polymerase sigma factor (sigma-70 family)
MTPVESFQEIRPRLVSYFERHGCGYQSEDFAQECLTRVWKNYSESGDDSRLLPQFAYGVARNVLFEFLRGRDRVLQLDPDGPEPIDPHSEAPNPRGGHPILAQLIKAEEMKRFEGCYQRLKTKDRQLWDEYYNRNADERKTLAADLGITTDSLKFRIHYIADKLRKCGQRKMSAFLVPVTKVTGTT